MPPPRLPSIVFVLPVLAFALHAGETPKAAGRFVREHWAEPGAAGGNSNSEFNRRFRVNSPDVVTDKRYHRRAEPRGNGLLAIRADEDLTLLEKPELYLELWGGHPGTANKRVTLNGRSTYPIPEIGTAAGHCTHQYAVIPLRVSDLVNGYNAAQFAVDQGTTFWGHFIVEEAALRYTLTANHPDLEQAGLASFSATLFASAADPKTETIYVGLELGAGVRSDTIASVEFQGHYLGYDENGDGRASDWHGFTKRRAPAAILGTAHAAPWRIEWDTHMLPAQSDMRVRAIVRFKNPANVCYLPPVLGGLRTAPRVDERVAIYPVANLPANFWSRANRLKTAGIELDVDPARIVASELHVVVWDGGAGSVPAPFKLNGVAYPAHGKGKHDVLYTRHRVEPANLRSGDNRIELRSDTTHHGIEMLLPGPALVVRYKK